MIFHLLKKKKNALSRRLPFSRRYPILSVKYIQKFSKTLFKSKFD